MKKLIFLLLLIFPSISFWNYDILDKKIEKFCYNHKLANDTYEKFDKSFKIRCTLIWQAQLRFESQKCKKVIWNNCFWFRSEVVKEEWEKNYWVTWIKNWFLTFKDKTNSIKFWVDRFYKIERFKTIYQIINWWSYISPIDWELKTFNWYTMTIEHRPNYTKYVSDYYKKNLRYLVKK